MKKFIVLLAAVIIIVTLSSFAIIKQHKTLSEKANLENDYIFYTTVTAWKEATESTTLYVYYKEGNGKRIYYTSCDNTQSDVCHLYVEKNKLYQSDACKDFRHNYKYTAGYSHYYFNCNLPYYTEPDDGSGYTFYTAVTAWTEATESEILYIYYKEGNGIRKYYSSCGEDLSSTCHLYVGKNELYLSNSCNDFRRNYKYKAYHRDYFFNANLPSLTEHKH